MEESTWSVEHKSLINFPISNNYILLPIGWAVNKLSGCLCTCFLVRGMLLGVSVYCTSGLPAPSAGGSASSFSLDLSQSAWPF